MATNPQTATEGSKPSSPTAIVAESPAITAVESTATALTVTFAGPLNTFTIGTQDFDLVHVGPDGSTSPLTKQEAVLTEAYDQDDPSPTRIDLALSRPLAPGAYQLRFGRDSQLFGLDGTKLAAPGSVAAMIRVASPGVGLADAADLGTLTSAETVRPDVLDLATDPTAVKLYRINLPTGHFWRVGLEVSSRQDGGSLSTALTLFDSQGHPITAATKGRGEAPLDPYLFAGLAAGTYYVGVSGAGNVPGTPGGYDVATSTHGASGAEQPGGTFRIHAVADVEDHPTAVVGLRLDHADPGLAAPTGLTVQFSGAIRPDQLQGSTFPIATAVDSSGRSWPLTPLRYDESRAELSFVFDQLLPPGRYQIVSPRSGGLVDLAGLAPAVPGRPAGDLGVVDVPREGLEPGDLGPILPGVAASGLGWTTTIEAGGSAAARFTVIDPGVYVFKGVDAGLAARLRPVDARGQLGDAIDLSAKDGQADVKLAAGSYQVTLGNAGVASASVALSIGKKEKAFESLVESGVGQGPALGLRLIAPAATLGSASDGGLGSSPGGVQGLSASGAVGPRMSDASGGGSPSDAARSLAGPPSGMTGLSATIGNQGGFILVGTPVGRASAQSDHISVVGPSGSGGSLALASIDEGLPGGVIAPPVSLKARRGDLAATTPIGPARSTPESAQESEAPVSLGDRSEVASAERDRQATEADDWFGRGLSWSRSLLDRNPGSAADPIAVAQGELPILPASTPDLGQMSSEGPSETASLASPIGLGTLALIAFRYRKWFLKKSGDPTRAKATSGRAPLAGPHRARRRSLVH